MNFKLLLTIIITATVIAGCGLFSKEDRVCFDHHCVVVEVVSKQEDLYKGLQFRDHLEEHHGMLFVFSHEAAHRFWMKDTYIPLDMIWINKDRKVVHVKSNVPPCETTPCPTYNPNKLARYVLEVNAGEAQMLGIEPGDMAEFKLNQK